MSAVFTETDKPLPPKHSSGHWRERISHIHTPTPDLSQTKLSRRRRFNFGYHDDEDLLNDEINGSGWSSGPGQYTRK